MNLHLLALTGLLGGVPDDARSSTAALEWTTEAAWTSCLQEVKGSIPELICSHQIDLPDTYWMQLYFTGIQLPVDASDPRVRSTVTVRTDGSADVIEYDAADLANSGGYSLFLNGGQATIEVRGIPGYTTGISVAGAIRSFAYRGGSIPAERSLCGEDTRVLSEFPWAGRIVLTGFTEIACATPPVVIPVGPQLVSTAFLIDTQPYGAVLAGHTTQAVAAVSCPGESPATVEMGQDAGGIIGFNWPPREFDPETGIWYDVFPAFRDQYHFDPESLIQSPDDRLACANEVGGDDAAFIGLHPNVVTGLGVGQAQAVALTPVAAPAEAVPVQVVGYGENGDPSRRLNQQTGTGVLRWNQCDNLGYDVDTMGGMSGGPVILADGLEVIGIHSAGGCPDSTFSGCVPERGFTCPGDIDRNNEVNVDDLLLLLRDWNQSVDRVVDFDCDGVLTAGDLLVILDHYGTCPPRSANGGQSIVAETFVAALAQPRGIAALVNCTDPEAGPCGEPHGMPACCQCEWAAAVCRTPAYRYCCVEGWDQACVDRAAALGRPDGPCSGPE